MADRMADFAEVTCAATPLQMEGRLEDGRHVYFRARWSGVHVGFGATPDDAVMDPGVYLEVKGLGAYAAGHMPEELGRHLLDWIVRAKLREEEIAQERPPHLDQAPSRVGGGLGW